MQNHISPHDRQILDRHAETMINEFEDHYREFCLLEPGADRNLVFEAWSIQKLANLQIIILDLLDRICRLENQY